MCGGRCVGYDPRPPAGGAGVGAGYGWMSYVHSHIPYTPYFRSACSARVNRLSSHTTSRHPAGSSRYAAYAIPLASRNRTHPCSGWVRLWGLPSHLAASLMLVMASSFPTRSLTTVCGSSATFRGLPLPGPARRRGAAVVRPGTSRWSHHSGTRLRIPRLRGSRRLVLPPAARRRMCGVPVCSLWSSFGNRVSCRI